MVKANINILNDYKNHSSIKQIENKIIGQNVFGKENFFFKSAISIEIKKLDTNKAIAIDRIPPKLIKVTAHLLAALLIAAINKSMEGNVFPDPVKLVSAVPLNKTKVNKNEIPNFRPASVLNIFSIFYEKVNKKK